MTTPRTVDEIAADLDASMRRSLELMTELAQAADGEGWPQNVLYDGFGAAQQTLRMSMQTVQGELFRVHAKARAAAAARP